MLIVIGIILAVIVIVSVYKTTKERNDIEENGLETQGVISRIEEVNEADKQTKIYFVKYKDQLGNMRESQLVLTNEEDRSFSVDEKVVIKYIPGKYKYANIVGQLN